MTGFRGFWRVFDRGRGEKRSGRRGLFHRTGGKPPRLRRGPTFRAGTSRSGSESDPGSVPGARRLSSGSMPVRSSAWTSSERSSCSRSMPAAGSSTRSLSRTGPAAAPLEIAGRQRVAFGQQHRPLNGVAKLADVAGPRVALKLLHRVGGHAADALLELGVVGVDVERRRAAAMSSARSRSGGSAIGSTFSR